MAHAGELTLTAPDSAGDNGRTPEPGPAVADLVRRLTERLAAAGVRYCHWKSNFSLREALAGAGDLDLLVDRKDAAKFEAVLAGLGFKRAVDPVRPHMPSVTHWYGADGPSGALIHLHVYYRMITGETFLKNYSFPLEELVLQNCRAVEGMPVPRPEVELIIFVVRAMMKFASLPEHLIAVRGLAGLRAELRALLAGDSAARARDLLARWLPSVDPGLFDECVDALLRGAGMIRRYRLGRRLRRQLRGLGRFPALVEPVRRAWVLVLEIFRCLVLGRGSPRDFAAGGAVIAFVGLDASGKSTLLRATREWLGKDFRVSSGHLGKPPSAWLTLLPNLVGRLLRRALPHLRMSGRQVERKKDSPFRPGLFYSLRMVLLAWDRRALAVRLRRKAANGALVLCDRYPAPQPGVVEGPRLTCPDGEGEPRVLRAFLARLEMRLYRQVPPPDIIIRVTAPTEVAVERNRHRHEPGKDKSDSYLLFNHKHVVLPSFPSARTVELSTNRPKDETIQTVRRILWELF
jgi:thymidylate kinase